MALQEGILEFPFSGSLDESTAHEHIAPGSFATLSNAYQDKTGTIRKRPGLTALSSSLVVSTIGTGGEYDVPAFAPDKLFTHGDTLCGISNGMIYSYSPTEDAWTWCDHAPEATVQRRIEVEAGRSAGSAVIGNYLAILSVQRTDAAAADSRVLLTVYDTSTESVVLDRYLIDDDTDQLSARITTLGDLFIVVWHDGTAVKMRSVNTAGNPISVASPVTVLATANPSNWDICPYYGSTTEWCIAYIDTAASYIHAVRVNSSGTVQASYDGASPVAGGVAVAADIAGGNNRVWVAYTVGGVVQVLLLDPSALTVDVAEFPVITTTSVVSQRLVWYRASASAYTLIADAPPLYSSPADVPASWHTINVRRVESDGSIDTAYSIPRAQLVSKPLSYNNRCYIVANLFDDSSEDGRLPFYHYVLIDLHCGTDELDSYNTANARPCRIVAWFAWNEAIPFQNSSASTFVCGEISASETGVYWCSLPVFYDVDPIDSGGLGNVTYRSTCAAFRIDFNDLACNSVASFGGESIMSGGVPSAFDGGICGELCFAAPPVWCAELSVISAGTGNIDTAGIHSYIATWLYESRVGATYRSAPTGAITVTIPGGSVPADVDDLRLSQLTVTNRNDQFNNNVPRQSFEVFRKTGTNPYRMLGWGLYDSGASDFWPYLYTNRTDLATVILTDVTTDDHLADNRQIYSTGAAEEPLVFEPPPSARFVAVWANRVWFAGCEKPNEIWYSHEYVPREGPGFSSANTIKLEDEGGKVSGLKPMDEALVIYKERAIYRLFGEGPNDLGVGNSLSRPQLVSTEYGCSAGHAILQTKAGHIFLSDRGLCLLGRDYQTQYIGAPVEDTVTAFPILTSAHRLPGTDLYLFNFTDSAMDEGRTVVFDEANKSWGVWTYNGGVNSGATAAAVASSEYYIARAGDVYRLDFSAYRDDAEAISMQVVTPWYTTGEKMAWQRVRRLQLLGRNLGSSRITIEPAYDYSTEYEDPIVWESNRIDDVQRSDGTIAVRVALARQSCEAVRFRITVAEDAEVASGTAGAQLTALRLEIAKRAKSSKLQSRQSG